MLLLNIHKFHIQATQPYNDIVVKRSELREPTLKKPVRASLDDVLRCLQWGTTVTYRRPYDPKSVHVCGQSISPPLFHGMCQHDHCDLLLHCHFVFLLEKPKWPSPNHFHLLPRVFGISSQVIFHPFPFFLLSGRNSSTIFF